MRAESWQPAELTPCPNCGLNKYLRSDSGLCERCHAVLPSTLQAWQAQRNEGRRKAVERSNLPPDEWCLVCNGPWNADTQKIHDLHCPARPYSCECGRRFWNNNARGTHERAQTCVAHPQILG